MQKLTYYIANFLLLAGIVPLAQAQIPLAFYDYARPTLDWHTVETEHFNIVFHTSEDGPSSGRTANVVARIAEEIYGPITELYDHVPDQKVVIILKDFEDYSNGAAYFFDNKIEIWAPSLDTPLRGDNNWLRNVITHEFTHIVQVQKTMKAGRSTPFFYFQLLNYENVRRPDVLYGYPNVIVSYPIASLNNPAWLAEGTAQYQRAGLHYDDWDTHRDMLLRTRVLAGEELSLADMGGFYSHNSLLRETVYNHGFAFVRYIAQTYGEEAIRDISAALGEWRNWNVERAIEAAVSVPGQEVYRNWMNALREDYSTATASFRQHAIRGEILEQEGFNNFHPTYSPDGSRLAYVSNKGEDFSALTLYVTNQDTGETAEHLIERVDGEGLMTGHTCGFGAKVKQGVGRAFTWRPDGKAIVYVKRKDTAEGYLYADLYEIDLESEDVERLTTSARATAPAYAPDGESLVYIVQQDGSTNLMLFDKASKEARVLTSFQDGTQVSDPTWHPDGEWVYFARQKDSGRSIYRVHHETGIIDPMIVTSADERSPAIDPTGQYLYYSSDQTGIYNIYRLSLDARGESEQITNVIGGAFMPNIAPDGRLAYAHYAWDGYKIAELGQPAPSHEIPRGLYESPAVTEKVAPEAPAELAVFDALHRFDDSDLPALRLPADTARVKPYRNLFTSFSFFPVLRLDQYVSRRRSQAEVRLAPRGRAETLLRNTKAGVLFSSREMLEGFNIFGGVLVSPASREASSLGNFFSPSRLLRLERDVFFQLDYTKGLSFIPKRWSPQLSLEVFNIRRNVDNGLSIEEFPCTACLPDTTLADLAYALWEVDLRARSKITRNIMLEATYRYSPYSVTTERFFSREADQFIPANTSKYFIGSAGELKAYFEWNHPHRHADVVPEKIRVDLGFVKETGRLLDRFDIEDGFLQPIYRRNEIHRVTFDGNFSTKLPGTPLGGVHGIGVRSRLTSIVGETVDDFYNDYVGGLAGARGYPFYALGGNETAWIQASYTFPLIPEIRKQVGFTYVDKVYTRLFADAAAAWNGPVPALGDFKKDAGAELRVVLGSFYLLPTAFFVSATYGFDAFDFELDEGFVTPDGQSSVRYGQSLQWHMGLLFGFDL